MNKKIGRRRLPEIIDARLKEVLRSANDQKMTLMGGTSWLLTGLTFNTLRKTSVDWLTKLRIPP